MRAIALFPLLISAVAAAEAPPLRLAVPGLQGVHLSADTLSFYSEHLAQNLRAPGLTVVTSREIATLLGLERQKTLLGCNEQGTGCIAELANALGVDAVVLGDIARFDDTFQINLKIVAANDAAILAQSSRRVDGEVQTLDALAALARELGRALFERKGRTVPAELRATSATQGGGARGLAWLPLAAGGASAAAGAVLLVLANVDHQALTGEGPALDDQQATALRDGGRAKQTAGGVCLAVGLTAVAAGVGMLIFGGPPSSTVAIAPVPGGAGLVVSGAW